MIITRKKASRRRTRTTIVALEFLVQNALVRSLVMARGEVRLI